MQRDAGAAWRVVRQDDNGNRYEAGRYASREDALSAVAALERGGHKQLYWVEALDADQPAREVQSPPATGLPSEKNSPPM